MDKIYSKEKNGEGDTKAAAWEEQNDHEQNTQPQLT